MGVFGQIIPAPYWLALILVAAAMIGLASFFYTRKKSERRASHESPLLRLYETRLQLAGAGDATEVKQLIDAEVKRRPPLTQLEAARRVYNRLKRARRNAWTHHNAH